MPLPCRTAALADRALKTKTGAELLIEDSANKSGPGGANGFRETTMTVRSILDTKGHQIQSIEPDAKLSAAIKILGERKIGAVLVMNQGALKASFGTRHRPGAG